MFDSQHIEMQIEKESIEERCINILIGGWSVTHSSLQTGNQMERAL